VVLRFALAAAAPPQALEQVPARVRQLVGAEPEACFERCHCLDVQGSSLLYELVYGLEGLDVQRHREVQQRITLGVNRLLQDLGLILAAN
jgi:hypothetical protein